MQKTVGRITGVSTNAFHFPPSVKPYINALQWSHTYTFQVQSSTDCRVTFFTEQQQQNCDDFARSVEYALHLLPRMRCPRFTAFIFLTDRVKRLNHPVLGQDEVNTGYADRCGTVVIYRKQEWLKVFLHECIHFFGIDARFEEPVRLQMFRVPMEVSLAETFSEVLARRINCAVVARFSNQPEEELWATEQNYAIENMVKVLRAMGLSYDDLFTEYAARHYEERTNVFAYVVLGAILCQSKSFSFQMTPEAMLRTIYRRCRSAAFLKKVDAASPDHDPIMRMSTVRLFSE